MFHIEFEPSRNLLHIVYSGHVTLDDLKRLRPNLDALLDAVPKGFRLLADLSALDKMDVDCAPEIRHVMDRLREHGVVQIVRVIPDHWKDIGFAMMSRFHYDPALSIQTVETMGEALHLLE